MGLRYYQDDQLANTKKDYEAGFNRLLLVACTGSGKTVYLSQLPTYMGLGGQTFVLVHREELASQAKDKIQKWNPHLKVGIEMGDEYADPDCDVVVASVATIGREGSHRIARFNPDNVRLVITDEAHHSTATTYMNIYAYFGMMEPSSKKLLVGVTATPNRGDGEALAKIYQKITHNYPMRKAIEDGFLCDVRAIRLKTGTNISKVKSTAGDFAVGELSETINTPERNQKIVKIWLDNALDLPTVAFTADIQHAKDLASMFRKHGVKAEAVWGDDPERAWKLARHRGVAEIIEYCYDNDLPVPTPEEMPDLLITVLCNCGILTEGYDDWRISCIIMARPTKSPVLFIQCIGRGTRLQEGIDNLLEALAAGYALTKVDCLVIDVVDTTSRNSLVTVPSIFGMSTDMDLKGKSALKSVKAIEKAQAEHPEVDFSKLESIDDIEAVVEAANIWDVRFPEEVENNSTLSWHRTFDGAFVINLPSKIPNRPSTDKIQIKQNVLEKWDITALIDGQKYRGVRDTIEEAFACGDNLLITKAGDSLKILKREAEWHDKPITDPQIRLLTRIFKRRRRGETIPAGASSGQASKLISKLMAETVTRKAA